MADEAEWLDVEAASRHAGLSTNTIYRLVREGRLPALCFPVRVRRKDLDRGLDLCRIRPGELAHLHRRRTGGALVRVASERRGALPGQR